MNSTEKKEKIVLKDYSNEPVPMSERRGWLSAALVLIGVYYAATAPLFAVTLANGLSFRNSMLAVILANIIIFFLFLIQGTIAAKEGLSTYMLARVPLGRMGAHLFAVIMAVTSVGWFAVQAEFFAQGIVSIVPALGSVPLVALIGGLLMMTTAIVGYKAISALSNIGVPVIILWCVFAAFKAYGLFQKGEIETVFHTVPLGEPFGLMQGIMIMLGGMAVGTAISPDIFRYAKSARDVGLASAIALVVGLLQPFAFMMAINGAGTAELAPVMGFLGPIGILVLILLAWTTNDNNLYSSSLAFTEFIQIPKWKMALILGVIASIIAALGILQYFIAWLTLLACLAPPFIGVMSADYYILKYIGLKSGLALQQKEYLNWAGITAWIIGAILTELCNRKGVLFSPIIGVLTAMILYIIFMKIRFGSTAKSTLPEESSCK